MEAYQLELKNPQEVQAGSRSLLYSLLAKGFRFPLAEQYERVKGGQFADEAQGAAVHLPYNGLQVGALGRGDGAGYEEFQSNYIGLFEIGGKHGAPSFLYEGEYGGGRMKVMEEVLRFYHHFGLRISEEKRDRPDHLASELEFMHLLTFKEAEALMQGKERSAYLNAERDFMRFHLNDFVAAVASRVGGSGVPFYSDLARLAQGFCQKELGYLVAVGGGGRNG
ncbi:MAG: molecular chaperone TorD family protein [Candidatus Binatia bacterium]